MSLTGIWEGYYFQNWVTGESADIDETSRWASPIKADLTETNGTIAGTMVDLKPIREMGGRECYELLQSKMVWLQKREWKLFLDQNPNVIMRTELPSMSTIDGKIEGREVTLVKEYGGHQITSWIMPDKETSEKIPTAPVYYHGELSEDSNLIIGTFQVVDPSGRSPTMKGRFRLRKTSNA